MNDIKTEKGIKTTVSALRRELKAVGLAAPSHAQMLEVFARAMGASSYGQLLAATALNPALAVPVATDEPATGSPARPEAPHASYQLTNDDGQLDLVKEGVILEGISLANMTGSLEDILGCTASLSGGNRSRSGELTLSYAGDTDVNWDNQKTRTDTRGVDILVAENGVECPADSCFLAPERLEYCCHEDWFDQESMADMGLGEDTLRVRLELVEAVQRWIEDNNQVSMALAEMSFDPQTQAFCDSFVASATDVSDKSTASALGKAQYAVGFVMHRGEFKALNKLLQEG